ncbi:hypothetical protein RSOLAG1IB_11867 [Rhizoctonia solani AG-1 IB]|uniref:SUR7 domain-containing protein n=1 Tax=Thanatephorus cucumeris (strain AG1-IB / isolate 7/3/14) TaxID=1108050 RepID=A0A0B7FIW0_THACB|nr:hypothetical protein RSOLAG1IB_11867 [Rhizoctonia solani AG-1 IB]
MFVLVLHPIACTLAFITLLLILVLICSPVRIVSLVTSVACVLSAIVTTVTFVIDMTIITIAKNQANDAASKFKGELDITVWVTVAL